MPQITEENILSQVPLNPYSKSESRRLNQQYGLKEAKQGVNRGRARLRRDLISSAGFGDVYQRILQRRKPVENELKQSAEALGDIENPFVRRQLVRSAENQIRGRRQNVTADASNILATRLQAEQMAQAERETDLAQARSDRDAARSFAATQYLDAINGLRQKRISFDTLAEQTKQSLAQFRGQLDIEKSMGVGNFAPKSSGGSASNLQFKQLDDGTFGAFDPSTGQFYSMGNAGEPDQTLQDKFLDYKNLLDMPGLQSTAPTQENIQDFLDYEGSKSGPTYNIGAGAGLTERFGTQ